ncbi:Ribonuclease P/MRP protein subunit POP5 [Mycena sanguinolenta]|uniref:Ribonuclease P/MRP protein subunit POP5 n=1 Tax=Mycena sanguinolenta TaxID=230812 RepID=A0A8H6YUU2_9AGAR|nr:Ribonuclease P/MRP protein subunit POP5 [Mycena sanguinolenta]
MGSAIIFARPVLKSFLTPSSMVRFKNRWLLVELIPASNPSQTHLDGQKIWTALRQSILTNFGDVGWGSVGLSLTVKYYSPTTNICIIRVARDHHQIAWGALTLLTTIEGTRYIPNVIHLSGRHTQCDFTVHRDELATGTIKHAQLAAVAHNREVIARYRAQAKTPSGYQDSYEDYLRTSNMEIEALQD